MKVPRLDTVPDLAPGEFVMPDGEIVKLNSKGRRQDERGWEIPDPTPLAPPIGYVYQVPLAEQIRNMVRSETLRQVAENAGAETFEEADDFDVGDDIDPHSQWENEFDPSVRELLRAGEQKIRDDNAQQPPRATVPVDPNKGGGTPVTVAADDAPADAPAGEYTT